jgi:DNA-binding XRE family transcriptional regulator
MGEPDEKRQCAKPSSGLQAALADVAERRRKDPFWRSGMDPTYSGPVFLERMTEADYAAYQAQWSRRPVETQAVRQEEPQPPRPQPVVRACLPFGERVRDLRRVLGWTQRDAALYLGVSARSIIRYEQGRSSPLQSATLLALRRLESAHAQQLDAYNSRHQRAHA